MVTPAGSPVWTRSNSHVEYGGDLQKRNYGDLGVVNAQTDVSAEAYVRMAENVAQMGRTCDLAVVTCTLNDTSPAAPTVHTAFVLWADPRYANYAGDAAPSGFPSAARDGDGQATFTFASSYTDAYGIVGSFVATHGKGSGWGTAFLNVAVTVLTATTVQVTVTDDAGAAVQDAKISFSVA